MTTAVSRGIDWLLRLDHVSDPTELNLKRHYGKTVDCLEMIEALETLRIMMGDTQDVAGPMYRGEKEFDFVHDLKQAVEWFYLRGEDEKDSALRRRKYRSMVVLMLNPIIDLFQRSTHEEMLELYNEVIDKAIETIEEYEREYVQGDEILAQALISKEIAKRNRIQHAVDGIMRLRRRKRRKNK